MCAIAFSGTIQPLLRLRTYIYIFMIAIVAILVMTNRFKIRINNIIQVHWILLIIFLAFGLIYTIDADKLINVLLQYVFYAFLLVISFDNKFYKKALDIILFICTILGIIVIITIIDNNFIVNNFSFLYAEDNIKSIIGRTSGNAYGGILGEVAYSAFAMNIGIAIIVSRYLSQKRLSKLNWIQLIIFMIGVMVSFKRSLLLIPLFAFFVLFLISKKENKFKNVIKIGIALIALVLVIITVFPESLDTIDRFGEDTANGGVLNGREDLWKYSFEMFSEHPLLGMGFSSYTTYCYSQGFQWDALAHNCYIQMLGEVGIIGFIIFISFFINALIKTIKAINKTTDEKNLYLLYFALFMQIVCLTYALTGNPLYFPQQMIIYMFSISILSNLGIQKKEQ